MIKNYLKVLTLGVLLVFGASLAYAETSTTGNNHRGPGGMVGNKSGSPTERVPMYMGTVKSISDSTITIESKKFDPKNKDSTETVTYTVNASDATFYKNKETAKLSDITVGERISVEGTLSGTSITATKIDIGGLGPKGGTMNSGNVKGTGEPVVMGKIVSVDTDAKTITIKNNSDVTYTVDLSNAKLTKDGTAVDISSLATDNAVIVQGAVNNTTVTASSLIVDSHSNTNSQDSTVNGQKVGFFKKVGNFFSKLFGF